MMFIIHASHLVNSSLQMLITCATLGWKPMSCGRVNYTPTTSRKGCQTKLYAKSIFLLINVVKWVCNRERWISSRRKIPRPMRVARKWPGPASRHRDSQSEAKFCFWQSENVMSESWPNGQPFGQTLTIRLTIWSRKTGLKPVSNYNYNSWVSSPVFR